MLSGDEVAELSNFIEHVSRTSMSGKPSDVKKYACRNRIKLQRPSFMLHEVLVIDYTQPGDFTPE